VIRVDLMKVDVVCYSKKESYVLRVLASVTDTQTGRIVLKGESFSPNVEAESEFSVCLVHILILVFIQMKSNEWIIIYLTYWNYARRIIVK